MKWWEIYKFFLFFFSSRSACRIRVCKYVFVCVCVCDCGARAVFLIIQPALTWFNFSQLNLKHSSEQKTNFFLRFFGRESESERKRKKTFILNVFLTHFMFGYFPQPLAKTSNKMFFASVTETEKRKAKENEWERRRESIVFIRLRPIPANLLSSYNFWLFFLFHRSNIKRKLSNSFEFSTVKYPENWSVMKQK